MYGVLAIKRDYLLSIVSKKERASRREPLEKDKYWFGVEGICRAVFLRFEALKVMKSRKIQTRGGDKQDDENQLIYLQIWLRSGDGKNYTSTILKYCFLRIVNKIYFTNIFKVFICDLSPIKTSSGSKLDNKSHIENKGKINIYVLKYTVL